MTAPHAPEMPERPPEAWEPLLRLSRLARRPLERFFRIEAASGILLLFAAAAAMALANSPWAEAWRGLWHTPVGLRVGGFTFERPLEWVVNDGLMTIFFFVVGMEIRRELHHGELSDARRAALPAAAALGGMVAPALLYLTLASAPGVRAGWGVPMATDIAFAVGVLSLLGRRVPNALRVLLLALAVIDDLGAILVIAIFYSGGINTDGLLLAAGGLLGIFAFRAVVVRQPAAYLVPGLLVWAGTYMAGVHPTIAGVVIGLVTPVRAWLGHDGAVEDLHRRLDALSRDDPHARALGVQHLRVVARETVAPAESLIERLHPWVAYGIMPLFALANAGVPLEGLTLSGPTAAVAWGVCLGLVLGKPLGIVLTCALTVKLGLGRLPPGLGPRHLLVLGTVAGIGFTMSLFIAGLAFDDPTTLGTAKLGVLMASATAGVIGLLAGRLLLPKPADGREMTVDEAEAGT